MAHLAISLLGSFRVLLDGNPVAFKTAKAQGLLAYLAVEASQPRRRAVLAGQLWPDQPESNARQSLRQTLLYLHKAIDDDFLLTTRTTLQFNRDSDHSLDVTTFSALVEACHDHAHAELTRCRSCMTRLDGAVDLYRGDFLADFFLEDSASFEEWSMLKREWLRGQALEALNLLTSYNQKQGEYDAAFSYAWRQVELDPLREEAYRQGMQALAQSGRRSEALDLYTTCQQLLAEELGVEPAPETSELYERIRSGALAEASSITAAARHNLPRQFSTFIGRETELAEIDRRLDNTACALLTIVGPGGVGKTRLSIEAARRRHGLYRHGVVFVNLAPVQAADFLVTAIADALELRLSGIVDPKTQLLHYLQDREMLLLLDNFEHLMAGVNLLSEILQRAPKVNILATSREALNLRAEWLFEVAGLPYPQVSTESLTESADSNTIETSAAVQLFAHHARRIQPRFSMEAAGPAAVTRICQLVDGLPLGIELAAALTRSSSTCAEIAQAIEHNLDVLTTTMRDAPVRQHSLRAVFDYSWNLLNETEHTVLKTLSVFRGGFTAEAAAQVADATPVHLEALNEASFLHRVDTDRNEIHEILRHYASEKLAEDPSGQRTLQNKHSTYYATFLNERESDLIGGSRQSTALAAVGTDIENVRQAWHHAAEQSDGHLLAISLESLYQFYKLRSWFQEGTEAFGEAIESLQDNALEEKQRILLGRLLTRRGVFHLHLSLQELARADLEAACDLFRQADGGSSAEMAFALSQRGHLATYSGDYGSAQQLTEESLAIYEAIDDQAGIAHALRLLGNVALDQGDYTQAKHLYRESLELHRRIGDLPGIATAINNLGAVTMETGHYAEAEQLYQESVDIYEHLGDRFGLAIALTNLGLVAERQGNYTRAAQLHQQCIEIRQAVGDRLGVGYSYNNLGYVAYLQEDYTQARELLQRSLDIKRAFGDRRLLTSSLNYLGLVACETDDHAAARRYFYEALKTAAEVETVPQILESLTGIATLLIREATSTSDDERMQAFELLTLALHHPASQQDLRDRVAHLLSTLEPQLPDAAGTQTRTAPSTLEAKVDQVLRLLSQ